MADTITGLIPDVYEAMDIVSREKTGLIQSVTVDSVEGRAAKGQSIVTNVSPAISGRDIAPSAVHTAASDLTEGNASVTLDFSKAYAFNLSGVVAQTLNTSTGAANTRAGRIAQAIRAATNDVEAKIAALHTKFSRAYGTAGTTPFGTNLGELAQIGKILDDNGAPAVDRSMVINSTAGAALRTLTQVTDVNRAGSDATLRRGELMDVNGFSLKESAQVLTSTAGTGASATTDTTGYAVGDTVITLASAGTGTIVAGDVITFAGDANKYVVASGDADVSNGGTITLAAPGLRQALAASAVAITVVAAAARNMAFSRNAIVLAARLPELPEEGDSAMDRVTVVDPNSGLQFEFAVYKGYRMNTYEIALTCGANVVKPEHTALLLG